MSGVTFKGVNFLFIELTSLSAGPMDFLLAGYRILVVGSFLYSFISLGVAVKCKGNICKLIQYFNYGKGTVQILTKQVNQKL